MGLLTARNMALHFHDNSGVAICPVRPLSQAATFYRGALQPGKLIQIARFYPQIVEFAQLYLN